VKKRIQIKTACARCLLTIVFVLTLPVVVQAQFIFVTNNGAITITGYTGPGGAVTIPISTNGLPVTSIGDSAFFFNDTVTSVIIPNGVTNIGSSAFQGCSSMAEMTLPNSIIHIGDYAFYSCDGLTNVTIPDNVKSIGEGAFNQCGILTNITIPKSVTDIGSFAFASCYNLSAITVDALNTAYAGTNGVLFDKSIATLIQFPGGKAGSYTVPDSVINIGDNSFTGCGGLTSVTIPNSVTSIGFGAFSSCAELTNILMPNSLTSIGGHAFDYCVKLNNFTIGSNVTNIGDYAFLYCFSMTAFDVAASNSFFSSVAGVLFNQNKTLLVQYPPGKVGGYTISNSVIGIGNSAFVACHDLTSVVIPDSVLFIGESAFYACTTLASIAIPNSVTNIGNFAFHQCASLTNVMIPSSVSSIGQWTFYACTSLTNLTIPGSVTYIGPYAFINCTGLRGIFFRGDSPGILDSSIFYNAPDVIVYYLPGTAGWGSMYADRPTRLWNPQVQTSDASFGVRTNRFGFKITGTTYIPIVVDACTSLSSPGWLPLQNCTLTNGSIYFSDPQWTNYPARFYRLRWPGL